MEKNESMQGKKKIWNRNQTKKKIDGISRKELMGFKCGPLGEGKAQCPFGNVPVHKFMLSFVVFTKELILGMGIFLCLSNKTQDFLSKWMFPKSIKSTKGLG